MKRSLLLLAAVLASACGPTEQERDAEKEARRRVARSQDYLATAEDLCRMTSQNDAAYSERCLQLDKPRHAVVVALREYVEACRACASAERCEDERRRLASGAARGETACPR